MSDLVLFFGASMLCATSRYAVDEFEMRIGMTVTAYTDGHGVC